MGGITSTKRIELTITVKLYKYCRMKTEIAVNNLELEVSYGSLYHLEGQSRLKYMLKN